MERANDAAQLIKNLGYPSQAVVNKMIRGGTIARNPDTVRDVDNSVNIYGKPVPFLRGKSVKRKPLVARAPDVIKRPRISCRDAFGFWNCYLDARQANGCQNQAMHGSVHESDKESQLFC